MEDELEYVGEDREEEEKLYEEDKNEGMVKDGMESDDGMPGLERWSDVDS